MADDSDILLAMMDAQWSQARQSEEQRATITNYIIVISAAVLGFIVDRGITREVLPLTILLIIIGLYGAFVCRKFYERFKLHTGRVGKILDKLDELHPTLQLWQIEEKATAKHKAKYPLMSKVRLNWLWICLHLSIAFLGFILTLDIII